MTRISWDATGAAYFQGISNGVLYPKNAPGVPWNGLVSVTEKGDDNTNSLFIDGRVYRNRNVPGAFQGTISAYTYPDEFEPYIGVSKGLTGQVRKPFGLTYRNNHEIHLVYNVLVSPSSDKYETLGGQVNAVTFGWDFTTQPVKIPGGRPTAHIVIMTDYAHPGSISDLEAKIYGDGANDPSLPDPQTIYDIFDLYATVRIVDNGDGTWTATGPDDVVYLTDDTHFEIDYSTAVMISTDKFTIHSL